jgi:phosphomannomutase
MSSALMVGVSGLRGVIGSSLTPEVASRFAGSFGSWLVEHAGGKPVAVALGRDGRAGNAFLHHAAVSGLIASGCTVVDMGVVTTPTAAVMTDHLVARRPGEVVAGMAGRAGDTCTWGAEDTGIFPHSPEPTKENLSQPGGLCDGVRENESDVGFAQDPDADRLAIIDERGNYIGEEYTLALGVQAILEAERLRGATTNGMTIVTNLSTSRMVEDVAAAFGARVIRTAVGEANVVEVMKKENSVAGGEGNGGVIWPRVTYVRDSLSAMALTLWLMSPAGGGKGKKRKLSDIIKAMPSYAIEKRKVDLAKKEDAAPAIAAISKHFAGERLDTQDGVRVDMTTGPLAARRGCTCGRATPSRSCG